MDLVAEEVDACKTDPETFDACKQRERDEIRALENFAVDLGAGVERKSQEAFDVGSCELCPLNNCGVCWHPGADGMDVDVIGSGRHGDCPLSGGRELLVRAEG